MGDESADAPAPERANESERSNESDRVLFHAAWHWDGAGLEIVITELPDVRILVPTLADATLATRKRITRETGLVDGAFELDLRPAAGS